MGTSANEAEEEMLILKFDEECALERQPSRLELRICDLVPKFSANASGYLIIFLLNLACSALTLLLYSSYYTSMENEPWEYYCKSQE